MQVWSNIPAIFKQRHALRTAGLIAICVALTTTLLFSSVSRAAAGVNQTLSFQGRLLSASGAVVPDGHYNIQFKIYQDGDGQEAGDTGGSLKWTETYINDNGTDGVEVKDGFFSVTLGSLNPFGTQVDWNQDTLWLSMNIAGAATDCTVFDSGTCSADGEMVPMKRITSTPYALNSGQLGGKTADNFVQLAQGVQTDTADNSASIYINKTGAGGNLLLLQNAGTDVFQVSAQGDITLGHNENHFIQIAQAAADTTGNDLNLFAGTGGSGSGANGGNLILQGGAAGGTNGNGGSIYIDTGAGTGTGNDGVITFGANHASSIVIGSSNQANSQYIALGANETSGSVSNVVIGASGSSSGGSTAIRSIWDTTITTGNTQRARFSGYQDKLYLGNADDSGNATTANGFTIQGTSSTGTDTQGGSLTLQSGSATSGNANGGNLNLTGGSGSGSGAAGLVVINTPAFQTASEQSCATDCSVTQANVDGTGVINLKASAADVTITMNDPTITTAGRLIYVTATSDSNDFKLSLNGGSDLVTIHPKMTATLLWNGSDWTVSGGGNSTSLQDIYDNSTQNSGSADMVLSNSTSINGLTIRDGSGSPVDGTLLSVEDPSTNPLFSVNISVTDGINDVKIGNGDGSTLLTLDTSSSAPSISDSALIGSMYYDTSLGELQCYESSGWGQCTAKPDSFITLSPEYSNAVMHGTDIGTMTEDLCSDTLHINDGTSSQPTVCDSNETYNYYDWTSAETTNQTRSVFVTYQLPADFKNFVAGGTSLMGRTDSSDSSVTYQVYRNNSSSGLIACGSAVSVSTGTQTTWQKGAASSGADPSSCSFDAGDSIVFEIDLTAKNDAHAYISNLNFAFSNQ